MSPVDFASILENMHPDAQSELLERLHAYAETTLRRHGPRASHYAFTSEEFVGEAITRALRGERIYREDLPPFIWVAGIVRSLISHEAKRLEHTGRHISIDADDEESNGLHELPSPEDLEAKAVAKDLAVQFVKDLDPELRDYVRVCVEESGSTAEELAEKIGTSVQHVRNLDRKLARRRAQWNSR